MGVCVPKSTFMSHSDSPSLELTLCQSSPLERMTYISFLVGLIFSADLCPLDLSTNAKWKGNHGICSAAQISVNVWVHTTTLSRKRTLKLYASLSWVPSPFVNYVMYHLDNLGLMPYRRQIVAVSKSRSVHLWFQPFILSFFSQSVNLYKFSSAISQPWKK